MQDAPMTAPLTRFDAFKIDKPAADREAAMAWAFPPMTSQVRPLGGHIIVQLRRTPKTSGLIILTDDTKDAQQYSTQIARVVAMAAGAFTNRSTGELWPEVERAEPEDRVEIGTFVRIPRAGLDRWLQAAPGDKPNDEPVMMALLRDVDIKAIWAADPLHTDSAKSGW